MPEETGTHCLLNEQQALNYPMEGLGDSSDINVDNRTDGTYAVMFVLGELHSF